MHHVPHLLLPQPWQGSAVTVPQASLHHLRGVLRLRDGATLSYTDGEGHVGKGTLEAGVVMRGVETHVPASTEKLTLAVAPPRSNDRARFLVEKLGELGVDRLVWLKTARTNGRAPRPEKARAWARDAIEQSGGAWLMEIGRSAVGVEDLEGTVLVAEPSGGPIAPMVGDVTLVVGPEGGLAPEERLGTPVTLGPRILRVETAAIVGAVLLRKNTTLRGDKRHLSG
jgi:16S rRNA (uracil1498-N3)-methyltransferase